MVACYCRICLHRVVSPDRHPRQGVPNNKRTCLEILSNPWDIDVGTEVGLNRRGHGRIAETYWSLIPLVTPARPGSLDHKPGGSAFS